MTAFVIIWENVKRWVLPPTKSMKQWAWQRSLAARLLSPICEGLLSIGRSFKMFKRDLAADRKWNALLEDLNDLIGKKPKDLNAVLFLIGVQELGQGNKNFSKEEKQDLMHI